MLATCLKWFPFLVVLSTVSPALASEIYPLRDLVECTPRKGLPNVFAKLESGKTVSIAYFGGSITNQNGWRILSREWFEKQYPDAKVVEINAAIGGTGSSLGVFRLDKDVLQHKPDLIFIEFASNDSKIAPPEIKKAMEGIIRKIWKSCPTCDICFVYTFTNSQLDVQLSGKMWQSASVMEDLADHYGIPSIHMGAEATRMIKDGELEMKAKYVQMAQIAGDTLNKSSALPVNENGRIPFSEDGVHPYLNTGHLIYFQSIVRSIPKITACGVPGVHTLPQPMVQDNWEQAAMLPLDNITKTGVWEKLDSGTHPIAKEFTNNLPSLWKAVPGASLKLTFKGTKITVYDLKGPGSGYIRITVDGKDTARWETQNRRFDGYSTGYRLDICGGADNLADQKHTMEVTVLNTPIDKREILFDRNQKDFDKHPEKYDALDWYAGAILIIGEIVE